VVFGGRLFIGWEKILLEGGQVKAGWADVKFGTVDSEFEVARIPNSN